MHDQRLSRILETVLYVDDLPAAERFYADVLGLKVDSRKDKVFVFFRLAEQMLLLFRAEAVASGGGLPAHGATGPGHVCFAAAEQELPGWQRRLEQNGVAIEHQQAWPRGCRSFYFRDPHGNSLEIASPRIWALAEPGC